MDEVQVSHFDIERSANGQDFETIGTTKAIGNTKTHHNYSLVDEHPLSTANYYRLKSIDLDGAVTYSKVVVLDNNKHSLATIKVYPNPTSNLLTIQHADADSDLIFTITDIKGQKHFVKTVNDSGQTAIDIQALANGFYFIECRSKNESTVLKFEKQ